MPGVPPAAFGAVPGLFPPPVLLPGGDGCPLCTANVSCCWYHGFGEVGGGPLFREQLGVVASASVGGARVARGVVDRSPKLSPFSGAEAGFGEGGEVASRLMQSLTIWGLAFGDAGTHVSFAATWQLLFTASSHLGCLSGISGGIMGAGSEQGNLGELGAGHRKSMYSAGSLARAGFMVQGTEPWPLYECGSAYGDMGTYTEE